MVIDGAALVCMLPVKDATIFDEYASIVFLPNIMQQLKKCTRFDVVWDRYMYSSHNLNPATREKRDKGIRRKVAGSINIPRKWQDFLHDEANKQELFNFLSQQIQSFHFVDGKNFFSTCGTNVLSKGSDHCLLSSDHEEANTRIVPHLVDSLTNGFSTCLVRTVDTDITFVILGQLHHLLTLNPSARIWIAFGIGKVFKYLNINSISHGIGHDKSLALPIFHSFTGCETTSGFFGKGKKSAWETWKCYPEVTNAFVHLALNPFMPIDGDSDYFHLLEGFMLLLYNKTSEMNKVDEAKMELFCHGDKTM